MSKQVILTGLRANNDLHIGNYFGALLPVVDMANHKAGEYQINLFVPDLHSFTTPIDHRALNNQIAHNLRLFIAAGLNVNNPDLYLYRQSYIPAHSELTWILDCFSRFGSLARMTQFKEKSKDSGEKLLNTLKKELIESKDKSTELSNNKLTNANHIISVLGGFENRFSDNKNELIKYKKFEIYLLDIIEALYKDHLNTIEKHREALSRNNQFLEEAILTYDSSVGLFNYPVLMAADILLYHASYVPVGEDQSQHLEFTRDIAQRINKKFEKEFPDKLFTVPHPVVKQHEFFGKDQGLRIRDLQNPSKKMSKSSDSGKGIIFLGDDPGDAVKKIMSAETDSVGKIPDKLDFDKQPGVSNLLQILALLSNRQISFVINEYAGSTNYGELKRQVAEKMKVFLSEFQSRMNNINEVGLQTKLETSEKAMNEVANKTLHRVQQAVGLRPV